MRASCRSGSRVECIDDHGRCYFVTARQLPVLLSLANNSRTVRTIAHDWPGMNDGMARSIVDALGRKGLVDADRFDRDARRSWKLSRRGYEFVDAIEKVGWADEDDEP